MNIDFPFHFDNRGRTAATDDDDHIRDMIEEFLFTNPGERVNRPDFGSGLLQTGLCAEQSRDSPPAVQFTIQAGLQRWLSDLIARAKSRSHSEDSTLSVLVQYVVKSTNQTQTATFTQTV